MTLRFIEIQPGLPDRELGTREWPLLPRVGEVVGTALEPGQGSLFVVADVLYATKDLEHLCTCVRLRRVPPGDDRGAVETNRLFPTLAHN